MVEFSKHLFVSRQACVPRVTDGKASVFHECSGEMLVLLWLLSLSSGEGGNWKKEEMCFLVSVCADKEFPPVPSLSIYSARGRGPGGYTSLLAHQTDLYLAAFF